MKSSRLRRLMLRSSIGTFVLRFAATTLLFAPAAAAQAHGTDQSVNLCPPSFRMTEHGGCQRMPAHVGDYEVERWKEIVALIHNTPPEMQACVWRGSLNMQSTQDEAKAEISRCQRDANIANAKFFTLWIAGILLLALAIGFRAKIAAGLYNLFVGCLALHLRFNRFRKRFFDNAIKKAEDRLG
jgi:hypothetical protein